MAKLVRQLSGDFDHFLNYIDQGILGGSMSASFEDGSDWREGDARVVMRVYERYSMVGSNRVSLSLTITGMNQQLSLCAITSGGSQAMFFKINRFGEDSFLGKLEDLVDRYSG